MRSWLPSQNGAELVCLHAQKYTVPVLSAVYAVGENALPLCDPSQNGWLADLPQEHQ